MTAEQRQIFLEQIHKDKDLTKPSVVHKGKTNSFVIRLYVTSFAVILVLLLDITKAKIGIFDVNNIYVMLENDYEKDLQNQLQVLVNKYHINDWQVPW